MAGLGVLSAESKNTTPRLSCGSFRGKCMATAACHAWTVVRHSHRRAHTGHEHTATHTPPRTALRRNGCGGRQMFELWPAARSSHLSRGGFQ
jgi:hypothetical protein